MAHTFYNHIAFIAPSSNASILALKNNLATFHEKPAIKNKAKIELNGEKISIIFDDGYRFYIVLSDEEYVNIEAGEIVEFRIKELDWNENPFDKDKLKTCNKRFEIWGDKDFDMDYFNDFLYIMEVIEEFDDLIIFAVQ